MAADAVTDGSVTTVPVAAPRAPAGEKTGGGSTPRRRRRTLVVVVAVLVIALGITGVLVHRSRNVRVPLLTAGVGVTADGSVTGLDAGRSHSYRPGSRVLSGPSDPSGPAGDALAARQRAWLAAGQVPGADGPYGDMVRSALLDIHTLTLEDGALVASWSPKWRYVWPRDTSMVAVALAATGHVEDATRALEFLQAQQPSAAPFQARYRPDGSGPPDARGEQTDGTGWMLWAAGEVVTGAPEDQRAEVLERLAPMIRRQTDVALRLTAGADALPPPSADYWEVRETTLTLGTAAPLAAGLRAGADLSRQLGDAARSAAAADRASRLQNSIRTRFGPDYPRHLGDDDPDAAVAFLLPPFGPSADPVVVRAWHAEMAASRRPAGGYAPGTGWKNDGISWTPQTALFAMVAARTGDQARAHTLLTWLDRHRTETGALPEKVLSNGEPAGPAPLTWTAALVVLAVDSLAP